MSAEIGHKIGRAFSIEEDVPSRGAMLQNYSSNAAAFVSEDSTESEGTLALGQIKVTARVTVKFELN